MSKDNFCPVWYTDLDSAPRGIQLLVLSGDVRDFESLKWTIGIRWTSSGFSGNVTAWAYPPTMLRFAIRPPEVEEED